MESGKKKNLKFHIQRIGRRKRARRWRTGPSRASSARCNGRRWKNRRFWPRGSLLCGRNRFPRPPPTSHSTTSTTWSLSLSSPNDPASQFAINSAIFAVQCSLISFQREGRRERQMWVYVYIVEVELQIERERGERERENGGGVYFWWGAFDTMTGSTFLSFFSSICFWLSFLFFIFKEIYKKYN